IARHETLRTTFQSDGDQPVQVIGAGSPIKFTVLDVDSDMEAQRLICEEAQRPFDLAQGPLLRVRLLRLSRREHILLLNIHHIVSDRWSMGVLSEELAALYSAMVEGKASPLPPIAVQYADFAVWQREMLAGDGYQK